MTQAAIAGASSSVGNTPDIRNKAAFGPVDWPINYQLLFLGSCALYALVVAVGRVFLLLYLCSLYLAH